MTARSGKRTFLFNPPFLPEEGSITTLSWRQTGKKGSAILPDFHYLGISQAVDWQIAKILDRIRITFRTFKMYMYYGTDSEFGKRNFRILFWATNRGLPFGHADFSLWQHSRIIVAVVSTRDFALLPA